MSKKFTPDEKYFINALNVEFEKITDGIIRQANEFLKKGYLSEDVACPSWFVKVMEFVSLYVSGKEVEDYLLYEVEEAIYGDDGIPTNETKFEYPVVPFFKDNRRNVKGLLSFVKKARDRHPYDKAVCVLPLTDRERWLSQILEGAMSPAVKEWIVKLVNLTQDKSWVFGDIGKHLRFLLNPFFFKRFYDGVKERKDGLFEKIENEKELSLEEIIVLQTLFQANIAVQEALKEKSV